MTDNATIVEKAVSKADSKPSIQAGAEDHVSAMITLEQLARDAKLSPRDARLLLRLAAKQTKQYPNLGKEHVTRQPWQWMPGSKALEEARRALAPDHS